MDEGFLEKNQARLLPAALNHRPGGLPRAPLGIPRTRVEGVRVLAERDLTARLKQMT